MGVHGLNTSSLTVHRQLTLGLSPRAVSLIPLGQLLDGLAAFVEFVLGVAQSVFQAAMPQDFLDGFQPNPGTAQRRPDCMAKVVDAWPFREFGQFCDVVEFVVDVESPGTAIGMRENKVRGRVGLQPVQEDLEIGMDEDLAFDALGSPVHLFVKPNCALL